MPSRSLPEPALPAAPPPIVSDEALGAAIAALARLDPATIGPLAETSPRPALRLRPAGLEGLARIVVAQQVSTASAAAIFARLAGVLVPFTPAVLAAQSDETLRGCGLSRPKITALRAVAEAMRSGTLDLDGLAAMPAEDALAHLVAIKGIGPWTAEVFLLFCLGHADAWPAGDLALQEAVRLVLGLEARPGTAAMIRIGERWRPYRGAAAYLLWSDDRSRKRRDGAYPA